jgi:hypothetical protein
MKLNRKLLSTFLLALINFYGCGAGGTGLVTPAPTLTGNWEIAGQVIDPHQLDSNGNPAVVTISSFALLSQNGTSVSGTVEDGYCFSPPSTFEVSGTLINDQLMLTPKNTTPTSSPQFSLTATVSPNFMTFQGAVFDQSACGFIPKSFGVTGHPYVSGAGVWAGSVISASGPTMTTKLNLVEAGPGSSGFPALSGEVVISGSPCFTSGSFAGVQIGNNLHGTIHTTNGEIVIPGFSGAFLDPSNQLIFSYSVQGGTCNGDNAQGTLIRQ